MAAPYEEPGDDDLIELSLLRDLETDALITAGHLSTDEQQSHPLDQEVVFRYEELDLHVVAGHSYPASSVTWHVQNHALSRTSIISLRGTLQRIVDAADDTNNLSRWTSRELECDWGVFEPAMVVLQLCKATRSHIDSWQASQNSSGGPDMDSHLPFDAKSGVSPALTLAKTTSDLAFQLLQRTPQDICTEIPPSYRVLHVEEVIRGNLAAAFDMHRQTLREKLTKQPYHVLKRFVPPPHDSGRKEDLVEYLSQPRVTFHGTQRHFVPSIVRYGFLIPGDKNPGTGAEHGVRCGSTYGRGIYSSPNADFSLSYTDQSCHRTGPSEFFGIKLLVCATLMGRAAQLHVDDNWRLQKKPYTGADSHVANHEREYIVFSPSQILPVYVIHIDWGRDNAAHFAGLPIDPGFYVRAKAPKTHPRALQHVRWPGDVQREKEATYARATKYFPYGFGPATGKKFVVLEVGEVDEDEEEYGDYQKYRVEGVGTGDSGGETNMDYWSWVKVGRQDDVARMEEESIRTGTWTDEYAYERKTNGGLTDAWREGGYAPKAWDVIPLPPSLQNHDQKDNSDSAAEDDSDGDELGLCRLMMDVVV